MAVEIKDEALTFQRLLGKCGFSTAGRKAGYLHVKGRKLLILGAGDGARTRDVQLGKLAFYH